MNQSQIGPVQDDAEGLHEARPSLADLPTHPNGSFAGTMTGCFGTADEFLAFVDGERDDWNDSDQHDLDALDVVGSFHYDWELPVVSMTQPARLRAALANTEPVSPEPPKVCDCPACGGPVCPTCGGDGVGPNPVPQPVSPDPYARHDAALEYAAQHEDEYDALASQLHESIVEGQTVALTAKALRILSAAVLVPETDPLKEALAEVGLPETATWRDLIRHHRNNEAAANGAWKLAYDALLAAPPSLEPLDVPIIDDSHDCESCRAQSTEFYVLHRRCLTCGQPFIVRNRKGDKPPLSVVCPNCEVNGYSWTVAALPADNAQPYPEGCFHTPDEHVELCSHQLCCIAPSRETAP